MAATAAGHVGPRIRSGLVVSHVPVACPGGWESIVAGHPVPDAESERAGRRALQIARSTAPGEALLVLLSGGASALMAVPADGVTLADKRATTEQLLLAGADIHALNAVRKHVSAIKGGQLAARASGRSICYAVSDVVGDDPSVIGSGPTLADVTTYADALGVLRRFGGPSAYPPAVVSRLERGSAGGLDETCKPGDRRLAGAATAVIGGRRDAMSGAAAEAKRLGYRVVTMDDPVVGEARVAAAQHIERLVAVVGDGSRPACVVSGGETTVRVKGRGKGGRNQEFALAFALAMESASGTGLGWNSDRDPSPALASVGTDGVDGPTGAAGAIVDSTTLKRARALGLPSPRQVLEDNNAYAFFSALGDLIHTGATDTNVGDLQIILVA